MTPLSLEELWDLLPLADGFRWRQQRNDNLEGDGAGDTIAIELATPLWAADVTCDWSQWPAARELAARLRSLKGSQGTFLATNPIAEFPAYDPTGSIVDGHTVTLASIDADNERVSFAGLPSAYELGWGDCGEVRFGSDPERRFVFEIHGTASADVDGLTDLVTIHPAVWPGVEADMEVNFIRPAARFFIVPKSLREGAIRSSIVDGAAFTIMQRP